MDAGHRPTLAAMRSRGMPFRGVLFAGLMIDRGRIDVLEFNARFGDPECEALMMRFEGDLAEALLAAAAEGRLDRRDSSFRRAALSPSCSHRADIRANIAKASPISGLDQIEGAAASDLKVRWALHKTRVKVFHAGTAMRDGATGDRRRPRARRDGDGRHTREAVEAAYQAAGHDRIRGHAHAAGHRAAARLIRHGAAPVDSPSMVQPTSRPSELTASRGADA